MAPKHTTVVPPLPPAGLQDQDTNDTDYFDPEVLQLPAFVSYRDSGDLEALNDATLNDWTWYIYRIRTADEMAREHTKHQRVFVTKLVGPLDVTEVQRICGGGVFEIRGFLKNRLLTARRHEIAGPVMHYGPAPAGPARQVNGSAPVLEAAPPPSDTRRLFRMIRRQNQALRAELAELRRAPAPAAPAPGPTITELFALADKIHERANPQPASGVVNEVIGSFRAGFELSKELKGEPERSTTEMMLDKGLPVLERLLGGFLAARTAPRRPGPPPPPRSSATVVNDPPAAAPPPPPAPPAPDAPGGNPDEGSHRWATAIEALARQVSTGGDPIDFAATLEAILTPEDIDLIRRSPADAVLAQLRRLAGGEFPVLTTEGAAAFVREVVAELKREPDGDEPDGGLEGVAGA